MQTLGYAFAPWKDAQTIADGPSILRYVTQTAAEYGVEEQVRLHSHYRYDEGYTPPFAGVDRYRGTLLHRSDRDLHRARPEAGRRR